MIRISTLPVIENADQFHSATLILLVDVLLVGNTPRNMREHIKNTYGGFIYNKETYIPITLTGTPDSLLANAFKPILFKFDRGFENQYYFDRNLGAAFQHKTLYDLSAYEGQANIGFEREESFIIERYITNRRPYIEPEKVPSLLTLPASAKPAIGFKAATGFKMVGKHK